MNLFNRAHPLHSGRLPPSLLALCLLLVGLIALYCVLLWPEWRQNPDLSHGFFAPLIFGLLVWESRRLGPLRWLRAGWLLLPLLSFVLFGGFLLFVLTGLFAASLGWSHALVLFLLAGSLSCFLLGGIIILADERVRVLPFNWISLTAVFLWLLVAPLPDGTYSRLTLSLQSAVTDGVMQGLQFLGVPARQHGNVIELTHTTVGVAEACSGVRSLISCVYAGFFFAAWQVRQPIRRLILIIVAPGLALVMNFFRSLGLTLLANSGTDISGAWHDATGLAILAATAALLAGLAVLLETKPVPVPVPDTAPVIAPPQAGPLRVFWTGTGLTLALALFFNLNSGPYVQSGTDAPNLTELLPAEAAGWQVATPQDLYQFSEILHTKHLLQRTYVRTGEAGPVVVIAYAAYWAPGQTSVSRVAMHTPDACWPGAGWAPQPQPNHRTQDTFLPGLQISPAEYRVFRHQGGTSQHVWFWHIFDGRVIDHRDPYSIPALLKIALQYGFRRQGSQYFIRISSTRPWSELSNEPLLREILTNLDRIGL